MAVTSRDAIESNGRDGGESAGRGDGVADQTVGRYFQAPRRVCSRLRTATESVRVFLQFRTHFVPMKYPRRTKPIRIPKSNWALSLRLGRPRKM